jgi:hypothetical protein
MSLIALSYALYLGKPVNEAYWIFKKEYEDTIRANFELDIHARRLMQEENIFFKPTAIRRLREKEEQELLSNQQHDFFPEKPG